MGLNWIIYVSHSSVNSAQSLNNICPGDLTSKARAGNHPNVVLPCTQVHRKIPIIPWMIPPVYVTRTVRVRTQFCKSRHTWYLWQLKYLWLQKMYEKQIKILRLLIRIRSVNRSNGVKLRFEYDHIAPSGVGVADQSGYRQLCSLWFEYDLCLNRKPPNDLESCLATLIRIRSTSIPKGVELWFGYDQEAPK